MCGSLDFCEPIHISDIGFINKERRVGRKDKLSSYIFIELFYHSGETSVHLRMKVNFRFVDNDHAMFEIISIHRKYHRKKGLFTITQFRERNIVSKHIYEIEFQQSITVFHRQCFIEIFLYDKDK